MAAFWDDMPLVVGINENWDEANTRYGLFANSHENYAPSSTDIL